MEIFIGKQPIFNEHEIIVSYELLYRNKNKNQIPSKFDGNLATVDVLINSFLSIGINELSKGKPVFINFTEELLMADFLDHFSPDNLVIEILEDIVITEAIIQRVRELKGLGYRIALDDFTLDLFTGMHERLLPSIDYIKVDFMLTTVEERQQLKDKIMQLAPMIKFLAEKVETREEYKEALDAGYVLFQGYFFQQPQIISSKEIPPNTLQYFRLLTLLKDEEADVYEISEMIECDIALTYKLLHLINSSDSRGRTKIRSIHQAIMLLGLTELQKWIYLLAVRDAKHTETDVFSELLQISLFRAKVCEQIARMKGLRNYSEYFLVGMFSNIDSLLQRPLDKIMQQLPFSEDIIHTVLYQNTKMAPILQLSIALNSLDWELISTLSHELDIPSDQIDLIYYNTLDWVQLIFEERKKLEHSGL
ncbi:MAG: HDOD domain-containing protein [Solibacillus sp.]